MTRHLMVITAFDSQLKWGMALAAQFAEQGWTYSVVTPTGMRSALSDEQVQAAGAQEVIRLDWDELVTRARLADAVVVGLQGPMVEWFTDEMAIRRQREPSNGHEPVIVTGWVGIIIEKSVAGYVNRAGCDVIAVNSADNLRDFTEAGRYLGLPSDNMLLSGLSLLPAKPAPLGQGPIKTVVFADQPTVPPDSWDRSYLYQRLIEYARKFPERSVMLKPRHRPGEATFHFMTHHPEDMVAALPDAPANFSVTYEPITELLSRTDLMLTVSSTAGLESVGSGVRTVFVGDLGVHERLGNHVLLRSGLIANFHEVLNDEIPTPNPEWLADMFVQNDDLTPAQRITKRVEELVELDPEDRPGAKVYRGRFLAGRLETRTDRETMPPAARTPSVTKSDLLPSNPRIATLVWRGNLVAQAVLPQATYVGLVEWLRRQRSKGK